MPTAVAAARQSYADHPMVRLETAPPGPCHAVSLQETPSDPCSTSATVILGGNKVADDYEDFYDGDWDDEANSKDQNGSARSLFATAELPFTGSQSDGTENVDSGTSHALGADTVTVGLPNSSTDLADPLSSTYNYNKTETRPFYALSGVLVVPAANNHANGSPTIQGTPRVTYTLTADTSAITDADGITAFSYQWLRVDGADETPVENATSATYMLTEDDLDKKLKVQVTFTDKRGYNEGPLVSQDTSPIVSANLIVQNTRQTRSSNRRVLNAAQPTRAQAFTTSANADVYRLDSIDFLFDAIENTSTADSQITVTLNSQDNGDPDEILCTLVNPSTFSGSGLHTFTTPQTDQSPCPLLYASTTYFVVIQRTTVTSDIIALTFTASTAEHITSTPGWSIGDKRHYFTASPPVWYSTASESHQIKVKGEVPKEITVPNDWSLNPAGLNTGDSFRLLFLTEYGHSPTSSDIDTYNAYARSQAANGHADIQSYSHWFRTFGSTTNVAARDNTSTTYTDDDKGLPIYWLNGNKVADDYEDFYDDTWDEEANPTNRNGSTVSPVVVWTGTTPHGVGSYSGGTPTTLGTPEVSTGRLNHSTSDPIASGVIYFPTNNFRYYALSGVFTIDPPTSPHRTWVHNRLGDAATEYENTGDFTIAQGFRTGGTAGVYEIHEISIDFDQGQPDPAAIQVRIVESSSLKTVDDEAIPTTYWKGGNFPARRIGTDDGTHTFTLALSQVIGTNILEANTNYFITIESTSTDSSTAAVVRMTETHDQTTDDGWAVDNHVYVKDKRDGSGWTRKTHQARIRIAGEYHEGISIVNEPRAYESCLGNLTNNRETLPEGFESCAFATQVDVGTLGSFSSNLSGVETTAWLPIYETIDFKIVIWPLVPAGGWVDVEYATEYPPGIYAHGSPAIADVDYIKKKGKVRFLPGDIAKTVSINIIDDRHEDSNEYVQVNLPSQETRHSSVDNYSLIRRSAFGTIYNTEETVELQSLNVSDLTITEGEGATAEFTVWLSGEVTAPVLAHYATHDGSAKAGEHYTAASGTLLIPHGQTSVTVSVPILNDEVYTGDRKFRLAISKPVNAGIFDPSGDATIEDDDPQPLTARFTNMPSGNHGESSFSFNISFNQDVATQYLVMQNDAMTVTNGEITHAERIDGSRDFWRITVQPDGGADVTVLLPATVSCSDTGAICSYGSTPMPQSNSITHTFPGTQLNAKFTGLDHYHDGSTPFNFTLGFSEEVDTTAAEIRDHALTITGGTFKTVVQKDDDSTRRWEVTVKPAGVDDIEVSIAGAIDCATDGHICTSEGELLAQAATQHSTGPELISVSDATVQEADGAELVFTVSIPEVWFGPDITVDYATSHGTATADDYTPTSGTLDFRWHKSLTVTVPVLTDTITEDAETITLTLSNPVNVVIADGEAMGTIQDAEPVAARPLDSQPTGLPVITGAFRADEPLTAGTSAIIDANGLDEVSYSYQWIMSNNGSDADLSGATASTYTPNNDQVGNTFKVRVSFTDNDGYAHTLTSEATIPLTQPTDPIVWSADMLVVEYSSISIGAASADLFTNIGGTRSLSIQSLWSYVPDQDLRLAFNEALDDADDLTLIVGDLQLEFPSGSSGNGSFKWTGLDLDWQDSETIAVSIVPTSTLAETTVPNTAAAGQPTITGTPQVGQVLTADTSQVTDADGLFTVSYLYQWIADDVNITNATGPTYTLSSADQGKPVKIKVSFNDDQNNPETLTSIATEPVAARPNTPANGAPSMQGVLQDQGRLTADIAGIIDADGLTSATFAYQWMRVNDGAPSQITGQTASTYTLTSEDVAKSVQLQTTFTDDRGNAESLTSAVTDAVVASGATRKLIWLSTIKVVDRDNLGIVFSFDSSADEGRLSPAAFAEGETTYSVAFLGTSFHGTTTLEIDLSSLPTTEQTSTWRLFLLDTELEFADATMTETSTEPPSYHFEWDVTALAINDRDLWHDGDVFIVSLQEAVNIPATGAPAISGTPQVGETLTADTSAITDGNGISNVSYEYQWTAGGTNIDGATNSSLTLTSSQEGDTIQVIITFDDDDGFSEIATSEATTAVAAGTVVNSPPNGLPTISGTPQVDETLTASTAAISDEDGLDNVSYQYQWLRDDADIAGQTNSTYRLVSADEGKTIKVRVTFTDDAGNAESLTSTATTPVAAQPAETPAVLLTASFANMPADHNGSNFTFQLNFSENVEAGYARIRDHAFTVDGATIDSASRITQGSNQGWNVEVNPTGNEAVTITLPETTNCSDDEAICTDDERMLSHSTEERVEGPPAISVSDATVQEAEGATLAFSVTLSHPSSRTVTVSYATADGTATAGSDYMASSGSLTFNAGDTSQTVEVTVLTNSDEEGQETLTLTLSNPSQATLGDGTGTGTIENGESSSRTQEDPPAEDPPVVLLAASFGNMPATHNGNAFTFDLAFSENVKAGYERIRDDAFTITEGEIINAQRHAQGSNQNWTITVKPDGNAAISITLPETTDCDADGAICTYDKRALSHSTPAYIAGPQ